VLSNIARKVEPTTVGSSNKDRTDNFVLQQNTPYTDLWCITLKFNNITRIFAYQYTTQVKQNRTQLILQECV